MNQDDRLFYALEIARKKNTVYHDKKGLYANYQDTKKRLNTIAKLLNPETPEQWLDDNLGWIQEMVRRETLTERNAIMRNPTVQS